MKNIFIILALVFCSLQVRGQIFLSEIQDTIGKGYVPITDYDPALATYIQKYMLLQDYLEDSISWASVPVGLHDAVTLAGSYDYITLSGQVITRNQIDLTTDVTGLLPLANQETIWQQNGNKIYYSTDNVGINESNPVWELDVNGRIGIDLNSSTGGTGMVGMGQYLNMNGYAPNIVFYDNSASTDTLGISVNQNYMYFGRSVSGVWAADFYIHPNGYLLNPSMPIGHTTNILTRGASGLIQYSASSNFNLSDFTDDLGHVEESTTVTDLANGLDISLSTYDITVSPDFVELTTETTIDDTDYIIMHDATTPNDGKITYANLLADIVSDASLDLYQVLTNGNDAGGLDAMNFGEVEADEFIGDLRGAVLFKAQAGETLAKGDVVYVSGISGNTTIVSKADADDVNKMPAFGVVAAAASSPNPVDIYTFGTLSNLNTSGFTIGDILYVSTTAGQLTATPPTGESALLQNIAKVTRVDNSAGSIKISGAGRTNATPNLNTGRLFVGNASNQAVADGTVYVDIANSRVGIGTSSPGAKLHSYTSTTSIPIRAESGAGSTSYIDIKSPTTTADLKVRIGAVGDLLSLYAGGSEIIRASSVGVGIGTASISATLDVNGDVEIATVNTDNTTDDILVHSSDGTVSKRTIDNLIEDAGYWDRNSGSGYLYSSTLTDRVGIGTTSPSAKLDVVGEFQLFNASVGINKVLVDSDGSGNTTFVPLNTLTGGTDDQTLQEVLDSGNSATGVDITLDTDGFVYDSSEESIGIGIAPFTNKQLVVYDGTADAQQVIQTGSVTGGAWIEYKNADQNYRLGKWGDENFVLYDLTALDSLLLYNPTTDIFTTYKPHTFTDELESTGLTIDNTVISSFSPSGTSDYSFAGGSGTLRIYANDPLSNEVFDLQPTYLSVGADMDYYELRVQDTDAGTYSSFSWDAAFRFNENGFLYVEDGIGHIGDEGTHIEFSTSRVNINTSGNGFIVVNDDSYDVDFIVESNLDVNAFVVKGDDGDIGVGTNSPSAALDIVGDLEVNGDTDLNGEVTWSERALGTATDCTTAVSGTEDKLVFTTVTTVGDISEASSVFTCTNTGKYRINLWVRGSNGVGAGDFEFYAKVNGVRVSPDIYHPAFDGQVVTYGISFTVDVSAGQTVGFYGIAVGSGTFTVSNAQLQVERLIGY